MIVKRLDPHEECLDHILDVTCLIMEFVGSWAWACSQSDEGGHLEHRTLEGLAFLITQQAALLRESFEHQAGECACFKDERPKA